ncbi:MAG: hypothetical protein HRU19_23070 [Pseudobacteriovorax sp.]|nr:hypothetical protein [Pseudobacteriovorax sp.]
MGKITGEHVAKTVLGDGTRYDPGIWFNSAKFIDIEYQTYGTVLSKLADDLNSFYWQHPSLNLAIHIHFEKNSEAVTGINTFGIRLRHNVFEQWLSNKTKIEEVLANLKVANFDPEFFVQHEQAIIDSFNQQYSRQVKIEKPKGLSNRIFKRQNDERTVAQCVMLHVPM